MRPQVKHHSVDVASLNIGITPEQLAKAIQVALHGHYDPSDTEAKAVAEETTDTLLWFFGYGIEVLDNVLLPKERDNFYTLERHGVLRVEMSEEKIWDGRDWRINKWFYNLEKIREFLEIAEQEYIKPVVPEEQSIYDDVFESEAYLSEVTRRHAEPAIEDHINDQSEYRQKLLDKVKEEEKPKKPTPSKRQSALDYLEDTFPVR